MNTDFIASNMTLSEFASDAEKKPATVADWRKRNMIDGYGQPHPSRDGTWVYSKQDVLAVYIANQVKELGGFNWAGALSVAHQLASILTARVMYRGTDSEKFYNHRYWIAFETSRGVFCYGGTDVEAAYQLLPGNISRTPIARVIDLESIVNHLPGDYQAMIGAKK